MEKQYKKNFLSMDLAERLIRVEQTVSASFNKFISYDQTEYYKSMSAEQKKEFEKFIKNKKKKKMFLSSSIFGCMFGMFFLTSEITGNVVSTGSGTISLSIYQLILGAILLVLLSIVLFSFISQRLQKRKFDKHSAVLENMVISKKVIKHK